VKKEKIDPSEDDEPKAVAIKEAVKRASRQPTYNTDVIVLPRPTAAPPNSPEQKAGRRNTRRGTVAIEWVELF